MQICHVCMSPHPRSRRTVAMSSCHRLCTAADAPGASVLMLQARRRSSQKGNSRRRSSRTARRCRSCGRTTSAWRHRWAPLACVSATLMEGSVRETTHHRVCRSCCYSQPRFKAVGLCPGARRAAVTAPLLRPLGRAACGLW